MRPERAHPPPTVWSIHRRADVRHVSAPRAARLARATPTPISSPPAGAAGTRVVSHARAESPPLVHPCIQPAWAKRPPSWRTCAGWSGCPSGPLRQFGWKTAAANSSSPTTGQRAPMPESAWYAAEPVKQQAPVESGDWGLTVCWGQPGRVQTRSTRGSRLADSRSGWPGEAQLWLE